MLPVTSGTLIKVEEVLRALGFRLRYEKGNFKSGSCLIKDSSVIVINKFLTLEQKILAMTEIISELMVNEALPDDSHLEEKQRKLLRMIRTDTQKA